MDVTTSQTFLLWDAEDPDRLPIDTPLREVVRKGFAAFARTQTSKMTDLGHAVAQVIQPEVMEGKLRDLG